MNWNMGEKSHGRGTSFKGVLQYVLHDKDKSPTEDRVGFVILDNLATTNAHNAYREMIWLCNAADDLKKRAGIKSTGRKLQKPVYTFALSWHEDDKPDDEHMLETARSAVNALGLGEHQAVYTQHTDTPHPHVHIVINLVHPRTGKAGDLTDDQLKLERWAYEYEKAMGVIRSPNRAAKFEAMDKKKEPPKKEKTPKHHKQRSSDSPLALANADKIRGEFQAKGTKLSARQTGALVARRTESEALWQAYQTQRKAIYDRHRVEVTRIMKHKRNRDALPLSKQGYRDWRETRQWKAMMVRQKRDQFKFNRRERSWVGVIFNSIRLNYAGTLSAVFNLMADPAQRRRRFNELQNKQRQDLATLHFSGRKQRVEAVRKLQNTELATLSVQFQAERAAMKERHQEAITAEKKQWRELAEERKQAWVDHREQFPAETEAPEKVPEKQEIGQGWKRRRNAAERKADGSYRRRDRER